MASIAAIIGVSASSATLMVMAMMVAAMIAQQGRAPIPTSRSEAPHRRDPAGRRRPALRLRCDWKDVGNRMLADGCEHRTGRVEEDGCWPDFRN
jgi:hypothetical protein